MPTHESAPPDAHYWRRRLWIERSIFAAVLLSLGGIFAARELKPAAWTIQAGGNPVVVLVSRAEGELVLARTLAAGGQGAEFSEPVRLEAGGDPASAVPVELAVERLRKRVPLVATRGLIYVDDLPVVALPTEAEATAVLEEIKQQAGRGTDAPQELESAPTFKERVEVRVEKMKEEAWADREEALALLRGEDGEGTHAVAAGENAWSIARRYGLTVQQLAELNPSTRLARLRIGQPLRVGKAEDPVITVVTVGRTTRSQPLPFGISRKPSPRMFLGKTIIRQAGVPGLQQVTYRVRCENGRVVERQVVGQTTLRKARDMVLIVGTRPRR